ncbi:hypothetical protein BH20CHL7_BH20CHL7_16170 [soil metagenome]
MYLDLTSTLSGEAIAASLMDGEVLVWATASLTRVATVKTTLDPMGGRLAVFEDGGDLRVITGSWDHREVAAYDAKTGRRLWVRSGLQRVQQVSPAVDGSAIAVGFDRGPLEILDGRTGERVAGIRGGRRFWQSRFSPLGAVMQSSGIAAIDVSDWSVAWTARVAGFAILAVSFPPPACSSATPLTRTARNEPLSAAFRYPGYPSGPTGIPARPTSPGSAGTPRVATPSESSTTSTRATWRPCFDGTTKGRSLAERSCRPSSHMPS